MNNKKKILMIILSVLMIASIVVGTIGQIALADSAVKNITVVHLNDIHGRVKEDEREGAIGFAKIQTKLNELRKENPNLLLLNAGDTFHGTTLVNITEGETMVGLMNTLDFDAMAPGNHDFNYGYKRLLELKEKAKFPIVAANIVDEKTNKDILEPYTIKEIDGVKIGIFGLTTEETKFKSHPKNTEGIKFTDPVKAAKDMVKKLKEEKVDIIIGLGHLGVEGTTLTTSEDVLNKVDGIDLFVDGHSHEKTNKKINDTLLVQSGDYGRNIGVVNLALKDNKLTDAKASLIPYDKVKSLKADENIEKEIAKIDDINKPILDVVLGETKIKLDGDRANVRTKETNFGNLIADTMLESVKGDVAFTNGGGIRSSIEKGQIKFNDIITAVPFTNTLAVIEATGSEIIAALERGVDSYPEEAGHFPQVSGITFGFDPAMPKGKRVDPVSVLIQGKPLELAKKYKVVTNDFIAAGGDGYTMFKGKTVIGEGPLLSDLLKEKIQTAKVIEPLVDNRIALVKLVDDSNQELDPNAVKVAINHSTIDFNDTTGKPFIQDNRTMIPVRVISESLGHKVDWNAKTRVVKIDNNISLKIGDNFVTVDGKKVQMDTTATIVDGRTYVPLKFITEALGYEVGWDAKTRTANILIPVNEKPALKPAA